MAQLTTTNSNWNLSLSSNDNDVILETAGTYLDKNIKISVLNNSIPSGVIMLWSGLSSNIPEGYVLCDGNNGTPNLTDKFVIGAGSTYPVGETGGESVHILTIDEMPKHSHKMKYDSTGWTAIRQSSGTNGIVENTTSSYDGQYSTEEVGNGNAHNNMPPYYSLCYIMKI